MMKFEQFIDLGLMNFYIARQNKDISGQTNCLAHSLVPPSFLLSPISSVISVVVPVVPVHAYRG